MLADHQAGGRIRFRGCASRRPRLLAFSLSRPDHRPTSRPFTRVPLVCVRLVEIRPAGRQLNLRVAMRARYDLPRVINSVPEILAALSADGFASG